MLTLILFIVAIYILILLYFYLKQNSYIFDTTGVFDNNLDNFVMSKDNYNFFKMNIKTLSVTTKDGNILNGWMFSKTQFRYQKLEAEMGLMPIGSCTSSGCKDQNCHSKKDQSNESHENNIQIQIENNFNPNEIIPEEEKPVLVYFHESYFNVIGVMDYASNCINRLNCIVIVFPYRGYGNSVGEASEKGLITDGEAILEYVFNGISGINTKNIFVVGKSLGGSIAIQSSIKFNYILKGIILENTFESIEKLAKENLPFLLCFTKLIQKVYFDNINKIRQISCPLLFLISKEDELVSYKQSLNLHEAADLCRYKDYKIFNFANHNGLHQFATKMYFSKINEFIKKCSQIDLVQNVKKDGSRSNIDNNSENDAVYLDNCSNNSNITSTTKNSSDDNNNNCNKTTNKGGKINETVFETEDNILIIE